MNKLKACYIQSWVYNDLDLDGSWLNSYNNKISAQPPGETSGQQPDAFVFSW